MTATSATRSDGSAAQTASKSTSGHAVIEACSSVKLPEDFGRWRLPNATDVVGAVRLLRDVDPDLLMLNVT